MATWIAKIRVSCAAEARTAKIIGESYNDALKRGLSFNPGPGCRKTGFELVQRGVGAGQRDRREGERLEGFNLKDLWPFKKKRKRSAMAKTVMYENRGGRMVNRFAGAKARKKRRR